MNNLDKILIEELDRIKNLLGEQGTILPKQMPSDRLGPSGSFQPKLPEIPTYKGKLVPFLSPEERDEYYRSKFDKDPCSDKNWNQATMGIDALYRQNKVQAPGYYTDFEAGSCFAVSYFDGNEQPYQLMNLGNIAKGGVKTDANGDFFFVDSSIGEVKIYLPKKEFWQGTQGKVRSFMAFDSCQTACKFKKGEISSGYEDGAGAFAKQYAVMYQLANPEKAYPSIEMTQTGPVETTLDSVDRGWKFMDINVLYSGYFITSDVNSTNRTEYNPGSWDTEYSTTPFDRWYDSNWGTVVQIGGALLIGYLTGGLLAPALLGGIEAQGARILANYALQTTAELTIAIPEAAYLMDRGRESTAAFVMLMALIPVVQGKIFGGEMADPAKYGFVHELFRKYGDGTFKTPADLKRYLKSLPEAQRAAAEKIIKESGEALIKNGDQIVKAELATALQKVIKNTDQEVINLEFRAGYGSNVRALQQAQRLIDGYVPTAVQQKLKTVKVLGYTLGGAFALNPILAYLIKDSSTMSPQNQDKVAATALKLKNAIGQKETEKMSSEIEKLNKEFQDAVNRQDKNGSLDLGTKIIQLYDSIIKLSTVGITFKDARETFSSSLVVSQVTFIELEIRKQLIANQAKGSELAANMIKNGFNVVIPEEVWVDATKDCSTQTLTIPGLKTPINMDSPTEQDIEIICYFRSLFKSNTITTCEDILKLPEKIRPPKKYWLRDCFLIKEWSSNINKFIGVVKKQNPDLYNRMFTTPSKQNTKPDNINTVGDGKYKVK
jgi:hypothetical protein